VAQKLQRIEAIGLITSGVARDFNNLLTVILTNARLLAGNVRDPDDQEGLDLIRTAAERGAKLTAQLLGFAREPRLEPQAIDLNRKIGRMDGLLRATLGGAVDFETRLAPNLWSLSAAPMQLELVILNLAINARDAMQARGTLIFQTFNTTIRRPPSRSGDPSPGQYVGLRSSTPAPASRRTCSLGCSSRSSPPRNRGAARASGSPRYSASSSSREAASRSTRA
jgi:nitrogen-specific signal transduction histidine kinase